MNRNRFAMCCAVVVTLALGAGRARAADTKVYQFTNNTGLPASDLHVLMTGTGGNLTATILVNAPGCPAPAIPSNGKVTNTAVIDWGVPCVAAGATVTIKFHTDAGPLAFNAGAWTDPAHKEPPGIGELDPERDVKDVTEEFSTDEPGTDEPGTDERPPTPITPVKKGCASCAAGGVPASGTALVWLAAVALCLRRRRQRRGT